MKRFPRFLTVITVILIILVILFAGHWATKGTIQKHTLERYENALQSVYPDMDAYTDATYNETYLQRYLEENGISDTQAYVNNIIYARDAQNVVHGVVVQVSSYKKYGGIITMLVGIRNDGTVNGYSILKITDAKGLDMKVKDTAFSDQFVDKRVEEFSLVRFAAEENNQIVAANGAEDASQSTVTAVNAALRAADFMDAYKGGVLS